jgi:hypothetical protein
MNKMADNLEDFIETTDRFVVIEGLSEEKYRESRKTVKKLIRKLRKGEGDAIFNKERYLEAKREGELH